MKIFAVTIEQMTTYFMTKDGARRFNRDHDEPGDIDELSKVEVVDLLNKHAHDAFRHSPSSDTSK